MVMKKAVTFESDVNAYRTHQAKLDHYNKWLSDPNRPLTSKYPGYPNTHITGNADMETQVQTNVDVQPVAKAPKAAKTPKVEKAEKGPRDGSKLSKAVEVVKATGKDDKEACIQAIVSALAVTRGNASIYYTKAKAILA